MSQVSPLQRISLLSLVKIAFLTGSITLVADAHADVQNVPGTTITMDPPDGYTPASGFSGFENLETNSSITVMELPAQAYPQLSEAMSSVGSAKKALAAQNIEVTGRTTATVDGTEVPLIEGQQPFQATSVTKYFTILEGEKTVLVTFNIFNDTVTTKQDAIEAIESIGFIAAPTLEEQIALLPYEFIDQAPFVAQHVLGGQSVVMPTFDGEDPTGLKPLVIISTGQQIVIDSQMQALAESLYRNVRGLQGVEITKSSRVNLPEGEAYLVEGATTEKTATQYLWSHGPKGYIRMIAVGESSQMSPLAEAVTAIAKSLKPKM